jgi:hypothetical protein
VGYGDVGIEERGGWRPVFLFLKNNYQRMKK